MSQSPLNPKEWCTTSLCPDAFGEVVWGSQLGLAEPKFFATKNSSTKSRWSTVYSKSHCFFFFLSTCV